MFIIGGEHHRVGDSGIGKAQHDGEVLQRGGAGLGAGYAQFYLFRRAVRQIDQYRSGRQSRHILGMDHRQSKRDACVFGAHFQDAGIADHDHVATLHILMRQKFCRQFGADAPCISYRER